MKKMNGRSIFFASIGLLAIFVADFISGLAWISTIAGLLFLAIALYFYRQQWINEMNEQKLSLNMEANHLLVQSLNQHRHDWMNEFQVLYGYLKLKKYDRMEAFIGKVIEKARLSSQIAQLGDPRLVAFLFSFNSIERALRLDIHMGNPIRLSELGMDSQAVYQTVVEIVNTYSKYARPNDEGEPNRLELTFRYCESVLYVDFQYTGLWLCDEGSEFIRRVVSFHPFTGVILTEEKHTPNFSEVSIHFSKKSA